MSREQIIPSKNPREDALNLVTNNGKHTLQVDEFLKASRPGGEDTHSSYVTRHTTSSGKEGFAPAIKGVKGRVVETGQSFEVRDDYDFKDPSDRGKGYHVNAKLGKTDSVAFTSGQNSKEAYYDRTNMTGERLYFDGEQEAAAWYTQEHKRRS